MHDRPTIAPAVQVYRAPRTGEQSFLLRSPSWVAHSTHFTHRTRLCPGEDRCPMCIEGILPRWLAWIAATVPGTREPGLLELTSYLADQVAAHTNSEGTLCGVIVAIGRDRQKWPRASSFDHRPIAKEYYVDTAWVTKQLRRVLSVPDTDTWRDAAAALLRHDMEHGRLSSCHG